MGRRQQRKRGAGQKKRPGPIERWQRWRRATRDAKHVEHETRRLLRKHGHRLDAELRDEIGKLSGELKSARRSRDVDKMQNLAKKLDRKLDDHLSFARKSIAREYTESIGVAVIIALLLRAFVVEAFKIPSGSMIPTLKVGDHLFVNKFVYGIQIPFTHIKFFTQLPKRGEVIVFKFPQDEDTDFIKRVVAVGGDVIEVRRNTVHVNGEPVSRTRIGGPCVYTDLIQETNEWEAERCVAFEERVDDIRYRVFQDPYGWGDGDYGPFTVPDGHVFVMGDNRDNSSDSRRGWTVPATHIKGRAMFVWYSRGEPEGFRWKRFFHAVHSVDENEPLVQARPEKLRQLPPLPVPMDAIGPDSE